MVFGDQKLAMMSISMAKKTILEPKMAILEAKRVILEAKKAPGQIQNGLLSSVWALLGSILGASALDFGGFGRSKM